MNCTSVARIMFANSVLILAGCGCHGTPTPPGRVNTRLPDNAPIYTSGPPGGDTVVVGRCISSQEYKTVRKGDWEDHWRLVHVEMIAVEKGRWDGRIDSDATAGFRRAPMPYGLSFVASDRWPTAESGIMLDKAPWPYRLGLIYAFGIDTTRAPGLVVGQEARSVVDPATKPVPIDLPPSAKAASELMGKIHTAVEAHIGNSRETVAGRAVEILEQSGEAYVVLVRSADDVRVLTVAKRTFKVTAADIAPTSVSPQGP